MMRKPFSFKKKNMKDFNTFLSKNSQFKKKFLIQASFIKKICFWVALSCSKKLSGDLEAIQTLKSHENQKWLEINRKRKGKKEKDDDWEEIEMEDKDDDWNQSGREREWWLRIN